MPVNKKLRIAYLSGPSEAVNVYLEWSESRKQNYFGTNYMKQFFEVCKEINADAYVITTVAGKYSIWRADNLIIENRPLPSGLRGILYHLAMVAWFARLAPKLIRFKPDVLIATANQNYWFLLSYLRWLGIPIVPSFHCVLWPQFAPLRRSWRALLSLNRFFVLKHVKAALVASRDIARQLHNIIGQTDIDIAEHLPTYSRLQFEAIASPANIARPPFRVFYAGRIEANKGIYDIVEIARRLEKDRPGQFRFDICGDGGELNALRELVKRFGLHGVVHCHGYLESPRLSDVLSKSHAVIVPTTTRFEEGFNMVCAEAILAGRPVITSAVCPALGYIREAAVEVEPDNINQYYAAILRLYDDPQLYEQKQSACATLQDQFYDAKNSWAEKLKMLLNKQILNRV